METVTRGELAARAAVRAEVDHSTANAVLGALLEEMQSAVAGGERVTLTGFGTFEARERQATTTRNPKTGAPIEIPARKVPAFKAGTPFKARVADA